MVYHHLNSYVPRRSEMPENKDDLPSNQAALRLSARWASLSKASPTGNAVFQAHIETLTSLDIVILVYLTT